MWNAKTVGVNPVAAADDDVDDVDDAAADDDAKEEEREEEDLDSGINLGSVCMGAPGTVVLAGSNSFSRVSLGKCGL